MCNQVSLYYNVIQWVWTDINSKLLIRFRLWMCSLAIWKEQSTVSWALWHEVPTLAVKLVSALVIVMSGRPALSAVWPLHPPPGSMAGDYRSGGGVEQAYIIVLWVSVTGTSLDWNNSPVSEIVVSFHHLIYGCRQQPRVCRRQTVFSYRKWCRQSYARAR